MGYPELDLHHLAGTPHRRFGVPDPLSFRWAERRPVPAAQDTLQARLHAWGQQAVDAASDLLRLYTKLDDGQQRYRTIQILDIVRTWMAQHPGQSRRLPPGPPLQPEDAEAELDRWRTLLEATTGILVFLTLAKDHADHGFGVRGQVAHFTQASRAALRGLLCAFPEDVARAGARQAIGQVLGVCHIALAQCLAQPPSAEAMNATLGSIERALQSYLVA